MRKNLLRLLLAPVAIGLALLPSTAFAADGSITHVEATPGTLQILVSVPPDSDVDLSKVEVKVAGASVDATAQPAESNTLVRRTAILAIDTSQSMAGARFEAAKAAAEAYLSSVPDDVYVGVVTFAGDVQTALTPTQDRVQARTVIDGLSLSKGTLLYDGVKQAVEAAGTEGQRNLLILSDGADTSATPIDTATKAIKDAQILTDVVALEQGPNALTALQDMATAGNGQVISSDSAALAQAFSAEADVLANQILVTATLPSELQKTEGAIQVSLQSAAGPITTQAFSTIKPAAPPAPVPTAGMALPSWALYVGPGVIALGLILAALMLVPRKPEQMSAEDRVTTYTKAQLGTQDQAGSLMDTDVTFASAKETASNILRRNQDLDARISKKLQSAGSELKSSEWLLLHGAIFFVVGLLGILIGGGNLLVGLIFVVAAIVLPWMYLGFRAGRRRKAFNTNLPDTLQLMSGSLAAGLSLAQSVDTIVKEGSEPIASEFRRVLVETRLGVSLEDSLESVAERYESKDFEWVVMAIKIQRQVGGNLAELLDTVAATMREREYVRRQVSALAAEGKLSAWVLGGLPPLFMVYLLLTNYDYVVVMFQKPLGWAMLAGAATILAVGVFWMSRLVKVEV
jgi:tight adherence protein B